MTNYGKMDGTYSRWSKQENGRTEGVQMTVPLIQQQTILIRCRVVMFKVTILPHCNVSSVF